ncbi:hypothetical protein [Methylibium petroleiphilum]|uniref:hypothetical protein n=1 Tax=Methylibium petroleiphilum TaxID=105560 RepID=UPI001AC2C64B|nr:hypothetical protein [Methylibium petroleiphilum]MBN9203372.1 hypothetical protein [Methylibium petroleiphilum]
MRKALLGAAGAALLTGLAPAVAAPCSAPRQVIERLMSSDCEACWTGASARPLPRSTWVLDWIEPGAAGADAPLAAGALPESAARRRALATAAPVDGTQEFRWPIARRPAVRLTVGGGPAWNGYLGLQLQASGKLPEGAEVYLALVENIPAGSDGSPIERRLVRGVAGPLVLDADGRRSTQWRALRIPDGAKPERLQGMAWWVDREAQLRGIALEACAAR